MARVTGKLGAVSFITGHNCDIAGFRLAFSHPTGDDTSYTDTGTGASHSGAGTVDYNLDVVGFAKSNVSNSAPGFATVAAAGGAVTVTSSTSCTHAGTFILTGGAIDHGKRSPAVPCSYSGVGDGDLVESWALA